MRSQWIEETIFDNFGWEKGNWTKLENLTLDDDSKWVMEEYFLMRGQNKYDC